MPSTGISSRFIMSFRRLRRETNVSQTVPFAFAVFVPSCWWTVALYVSSQKNSRKTSARPIKTIFARASNTRTFHYEIHISVDKSPKVVKKNRTRTIMEKRRNIRSDRPVFLEERRAKLKYFYTHTHTFIVLCIFYMHIKRGSAR